jgi:error-prone DNA polymerase
VSPQAIRCSLQEVKGISDAEITRIVAGQPYTSLRDFWARAGVSRPVAERLVLIGAFDSLYDPASRHASPDKLDSLGSLDSLASVGSLDSLASLDSPCFLDSPGAPNVRVAPGSPPLPASPLPAPPLPASPRPSRRDLLARVGVLARQSSPARTGAPALDLFAEAGAEVADAEAGDGMADLVPAGQLRDLDLTERVAAELEILGFDLSQHVLHFYADLLAALGVVRSAGLPDRDNGETVLVAGAKIATQTPAVRSGQRIIFASLDDAAGLVDLAFFESVQDRCAARVFGSWLLLVRGRVRRAGAGPMAVTVNGYECWDIPALDEIRLSGGMDAVRAAMAAGDVGPGAHQGLQDQPPAARSAAAKPGAAGPNGSAAPVTFANGFVLSPYAETGGPGGDLKHPPRTFWHASPGSTATPN